MTGTRQEAPLLIKLIILYSDWSGVSMTNEEMVMLIKQGQDLTGELYIQNKRFIYKCVRPFQSTVIDVEDLMQIQREAHPRAEIK